MAVFTMTSAASGTRKPKRLVPNPLGESAELERKYFSIREWRGQDLISLLFRTSIRLQTTFDRRFLQFGITAQEAAVLLRCVEEGRTSAGKLAQAMRRDKGKITRFVNRLEAAKLLTRIRNQHDHRLQIIQATKFGHRLAPKFRAIFEEIRGQFLEGIQISDIDHLGTLLAQVYENAGRLHEDRASRKPRKNSNRRPPG
jgi:DNA-binding MarR family transcriptional regulator